MPSTSGSSKINEASATPGMVREFGFDQAQITDILSAWSIAYGTGQLINGLFCDRIGGRASMIIGAAGTIAINLIYGFASCHPAFIISCNPATRSLFSGLKTMLSLQSGSFLRS